MSYIPPTPIPESYPRWVKGDLITYSQFTEDGGDSNKATLTLDPLTTAPKAAILAVAVEMVQLFDGGGGISGALMDISLNGNGPIITGKDVNSISPPNFSGPDAGSVPVQIAQSGGDNIMNLEINIGAGPYSTAVTQGSFYLHLLVAQLQ